MKDKNTAKPVPLPRYQTGYEYKILMSVAMDKKLALICKKSKRTRQHLVKYLVDYALSREYHQRFAEFQRIRNPSTVRVFSSPHWWERMKDYAWEHKIYQNSAGQFAGLCVTHALYDHPIDWWAEFFYMGKDIENRSLKFIHRLADDRS